MKWPIFILHLIFAAGILTSTQGEGLSSKSFFTEKAVWPPDREDVFGFAYDEGHYFILNGYTLEILEEGSDPTNLATTGQLTFPNLSTSISPDDGLNEIIILGSRAYIREQGAGNVWHVVDISDLTKPKLASAPPFLSGRFNAKGGIAVSSSHQERTKIFEVLPSGELELLSEVEAAGNPFFLGDHLMLQFDGASVAPVNISDPRQPVQEEWLFVSGLGPLAFWHDYSFDVGEILEVWDFRVPTKPKLKTSLAGHRGTEWSGAFVDYPFLFAMGHNQRSFIQAFNIADPRHPRHLATMEVSGAIHDLKVIDSQLVISTRHWNADKTDRTGQLHVFDMLADHDVDTDRDGHTDVMEFAIGSPVTSNKATSLGVIEADGALTFRYMRGSHAKGIFDYTVEVSADLKPNSWELASEEILVSAVFGNELVDVPLAATHPYARLRVQEKP